MITNYVNLLVCNTESNDEKKKCVEESFEKSETLYFGCKIVKNATQYSIFTLFTLSMLHHN